MAARLSAEGIPDLAEDALVVRRAAGAGLVRRPPDGAELLVERALLLAERPRDDDVEVHDLVAPAARVQPRDALAAQPDRLAVLRPGGDPHRRLAALDGRHRRLVAERGLRRRDPQDVDDVVRVAAEERVLAEPDEDVEVPGRAAAHARLALPADADLLPVVDPRGEGDGHLALGVDAPLSAAIAAELVDD